MTIAKIIERVSGTATTSDGSTITTVCTFTVPLSSNVLIEGFLVGKDGAGNVATARTTHRAKRGVGSASLVGSVVDLITFTLGSDAALATCVLTIDTSTNDIRLRVTGVAATTIDWFGTMIIHIN